MALGRRIAADARVSEPGLALPDFPAPGEASPAEEMGVFWSALHEFALADAVTSGAVFVSHTELPSGGVEAGRALAARLGLTWSPAMSAEFSKESSINRAAPTQLHNFDRAPAAVAEEWRSKLGESDIERIEQVASGTLAKVEAARIPLS